MLRNTHRETTRQLSSRRAVRNKNFTSDEVNVGRQQTDSPLRKNSRTLVSDLVLEGASCETELARGFQKPNSHRVQAVKGLLEAVC